MGCSAFSTSLLLPPPPLLPLLLPPLLLPPPPLLLFSETSRSAPLVPSESKSLFLHSKQRIPP
jgi:hypothetical protein